VSTVVTAMFSCPLGDDAALLPRTAAISDAYHELLAANHERLARVTVHTEAANQRCRALRNA
jgi:ribosomal-protein-serine acetyltransferase